MSEMGPKIPFPDSAQFVLRVISPKERDMVREITQLFSTPTDDIDLIRKQIQDVVSRVYDTPQKKVTWVGDGDKEESVRVGVVPINYTPHPFSLELRRENGVYAFTFAKEDPDMEIIGRLLWPRKYEDTEPNI